MIKLFGYELIIGSSIDPQFRSRTAVRHGRPARRSLQGPRPGLAPAQLHPRPQHDAGHQDLHALKGVRGRKSIDLAELDQLLVRFSQLVVEQPWIKEIDINPLLASPERLVALDARVVVYGLDVPQDKLPRLAIRPYPTRYVAPWTAKDGTDVLIRPIRPRTSRSSLSSMRRSPSAPYTSATCT